MSTHVKASAPVIAKCICAINGIILLKRANERGFAVQKVFEQEWAQKWGRFDFLAFPDQESRKNSNNQWKSWLLTI
jgi:hypothetical protein